MSVIWCFGAVVFVEIGVFRELVVLFVWILCVVPLSLCATALFLSDCFPCHQCSGQVTSVGRVRYVRGLDQ